MMYDVLVLGGGIVGASTAYALARQGLRVALIEQFEAGHRRGSSHGDSRIVRFNYSEAIYVEMALLAYPAWERLGVAAAQPLIQTSGLLECGPFNCQPIKDVAANLEHYNVAFERLSARQAAARFPQFQFEDGTDILFQADGAVAFATPAVLALWRLFMEMGGSGFMGQRVEQIEIAADSVKLRSADQSWEGRRLVLASGGWSAGMAARLGLKLPITVTQEVLAYFPSQDRHVDHSVGVMPSIIDYTDEEQPFYALPQVEVPGVKVGLHHSGPEIDADDPQPVPPEILGAMQEWVAARFPHLKTEPIHVLQCLYSNTPDFHFILDRHPVYPHVVIGAGFSGHGFKFGPTLGELLAALVMEQEPPLALETFSIARFEHPEQMQKRSGA